MAEEREWGLLVGYASAGFCSGFVFVRPVLGLAVWMIVGDRNNIPDFLELVLLPILVFGSPIWCSLIGLWIGLRRTAQPAK